MPQKERTVQPSDDEVSQTETYQKTRTIAKDQLERQLVDQVNDSPSLQNAEANLETVESDVEQRLKGPEQETLQLQEKALQSGIAANEAEPAAPAEEPVSEGPTFVKPDEKQTVTAETKTTVKKKARKKA